MTPFECYELCVQSPRHVVAFLYAAHGNEPSVLREEFCGTAAVSRRWIEDRRRHDAAARAIAVDLDAETLESARAGAAESGVAHAIDFLHADCIPPNPAPGTRRPAPPPAPADILFIGNFSIGYIHRRADLVAYLSRARDILSRGHGGFGGGIFACDTYGGAAAFRRGGTQRRHPGRAGEVIHYTWVHEHADPITAMVENSISFRVEKNGEIVQEFPRAFVYRWRLWSIAELREAMLEVGFTSVEVYKDVNVAPGQAVHPIEDPAELGDDWIVMVVARA